MKTIERAGVWPVLLVLGAAFSGMVGADAGAAAIAGPEALGLLERIVPGAAAFEAQPAEWGGRPGFRVTGEIAGVRYAAVIDAVVPRVIRVEKNGTEAYAWGGVLAVAHRGAMRWAPENTIAAFRKAIEFGAHCIEMDVRQTRDGHFVLMHDITVFRTTGGKGMVSMLTLGEIQQLDAGSRFSAEFAGERVPTFEEALDAIAGKALPDIDFKAGDPARLVDIVREKGLLGRATLANNDAEILRKVIEQSGGRVLIRPALPNGPDPIGALQQGVNPPLVNIDDMDRFREIHCAGMKVFTNTMSRSDDEEARIKTAIDRHADYIQTDRLDILVPLLKERGLYAPHP